MRCIICYLVVINLTWLFTYLALVLLVLYPDCHYNSMLQCIASDQPTQAGVVIQVTLSKTGSKLMLCTPFADRQSPASVGKWLYTRWLPSRHNFYSATEMSKSSREPEVPFPPLPPLAERQRSRVVSPKFHILSDCITSRFVFAFGGHHYALPSNNFLDAYRQTAAWGSVTDPWGRLYVQSRPPGPRAWVSSAKSP